MKRSTLLLMGWLVAASSAAAVSSPPNGAPAQPAAAELRDQTSPEYQAIAEATKRYETAYNAGDARS